MKTKIGASFGLTLLLAAGIVATMLALGMFSSFHNPSVKQSNREKVITTRVEIIGELSEEKRRTLIRSRFVALKKNPDIEAQDQKVQDAVMPNVSSNARTAFLASWSAIQKSSEN